KHGIPPTIPNEPSKKASKAEGISQVVDSSGKPLPVLQVGHANSFIKKLSLTQISDSAMKAVLLERMARDRKYGPRSTKSHEIRAGKVTPLTLPLKGDMVVLGHPSWKPFRSFYLDADIYLVDGVYKIMEVTHNL